jgi:Uncharacterised nucleotidyltransferase
MGSSLSLLTRFLSEPPDLTVIADAAAWKIVKTNAARHGVGPLVAHAARPHVTGPERAWCDRVLLSSWTRHEQSLRELDDILARLDDAGVPALVLKGPLLGLRYYQPPFLRKPSSDLDLAVKEEDLDRAFEALAPLGYAPEASMRESRAINHHVAMEHPSRSSIELHFRLTHKALGIPVAGFLDRGVEYALPGGRKARILSPADEIFHLVLHRASGRFATLFHLCEVRKIWNAASPEVRREAVEMAVRHHFAGVFAMTDIAFRAHWGESMLTIDAIEPTWLHWRLTARLYDEFERCSDPGRELPLTIRLKRKWLDFQITDQPRDALRFTAEMGRIAWFQLFRKGWKTVRVN